MFAIKIALNSTESHDYKMTKSLGQTWPEWPRWTFCRFVWPYIYMVLYGITWPFCGLLLENINLIGLESSFFAVIDPNSVGLVGRGYYISLF